MDNKESIYIIELKKGWMPVDLLEIFRFRGLLYFLGWRETKFRHKTVLDAGWAIIHLLLLIILSGIFYFKRVKIFLADICNFKSRKCQTPMIKAEHLSKQYKIGVDRTYIPFQDAITSTVKSPLKLFNQKYNDTFWSLKYVSFEIEEGEVLSSINGKLTGVLI